MSSTGHTSSGLRSPWQRASLSKTTLSSASLLSLPSQRDRNSQPACMSKTKSQIPPSPPSRTTTAWVPLSTDSLFPSPGVASLKSTILPTTPPLHASSASSSIPTDSNARPSQKLRLSLALSGRFAGRPASAESSSIFS